MAQTIQEIIEENKRRNKKRSEKYDPITGAGADTVPRIKFLCRGICEKPILIPEKCFNEPIIKKLCQYGSIDALLTDKNLTVDDYNRSVVIDLYHAARVKWDFEYWAATDVYITDLESERDVHLVLNPAQRNFYRQFAADWFDGKPCRFIITKNRQNGFSTLIEMLFGWIQIITLGNVNSIICAHIENTAKIIRGMYSKMVRMYPKEYTPNGDGLSLTPFEGSQKTRVIKQTGSRISIGSAEQPDALVGDKITLFHASEVGLYKTTNGKTPQQLVQSIQSGIQHREHTAIIYESTARGIGNFFYEEWMRATSGESGFVPVFVPWFDNLSYEMPVKDLRKFAASLTLEEYNLFKKGATLEGLYWRRNKKKEYADEWRFKQDFPASADEAFMSTGHRYYPIEDTERLRKGCFAPSFVGDIVGDATTGAESMKNIKFTKLDGGNLKVWFMPEEERYSNRYVVVVDIGGVSAKADRSVICVIDRKDMAKAGVPIVVAEWCGHIAHDLLAWKAVQLATVYQKALLVIESNTLEKERTEGDHFEFILDEIANEYGNLYSRTPSDKIAAGVPARYGFHTNRSTKPMVCDHHRKVLRENMYIETCVEAVDEHDWFEQKENGELGAIDGQHDDRHITRAIGIWVCYQELPYPRLIKKLDANAVRKTKKIGLSSF